MLAQLLSRLRIQSLVPTPNIDGDDSGQDLSEFMCDSKLSVSESTITEFSRALELLDPPKDR